MSERTEERLTLRSRQPAGEDRVPVSKLTDRLKMAMLKGGAIAVLLVLCFLGGKALAHPAVHPLPIPPALARARGVCQSTDATVTCLRGKLREAYQGIAWSKKQRLHTRSLSASSLTPLEVGRELSMRRSWGGRQFACLAVLWSRESGWSPTKSNYAGSGAYGIPQALPAEKMRTAGADWRTNAATQIRWGLGYIAQRYGSPCAALAHSDAHGYY